MRSNLSRKIPLPGIAHPVEEIYLFQVPKTHLGMGRIRGFRDEEMATCSLIMSSCKNMGKRPSSGKFVIKTNCN